MKRKNVKVTIDRPYGSIHPKHSNIIYPVNYGYVDGIIAGDGEEQDVYVLGIQYPIEFFEGEVIAIVERLDDNEDKWIAAKKGEKYTLEEIERILEFQEKYFKHQIHILK